MTMISFRLNENELALLRIKAGEGESLSLVAKRLLLESLGVAKRDDIPKDIYSIVRELIADSIKEGDIGDAIDKCRQSLIGHIEGLEAKVGIVEWVNPVDTCKQSVDIPEVITPVDTCKQSVDIPEVITPVDTCKQSVDIPEVITPVDTCKQSVDIPEVITPVDTCKQSVDIPEDITPVDTCKQDVDKTKLITLLGLEDILDGDLYNAETLEKDGYFKAMADNKAKIAEISGIEVKLTEDLTDMNAIIKWLGYKSIRTTQKNLSYRRVTGKL